MMEKKPDGNSQSNNGGQDSRMQNRKGLVHIYCGDGKGKTSAAVGLAVRAAGRGMKVLMVRF